MDVAPFYSFYVVHQKLIISPHIPDYSLNSCALYLYYIEHRDLAFYADRLNISTTYLSRIVRQMSGRTVQDFLAQALTAEAAIRLKTTHRSITQLADDFHFSDQAAFTKFFTRMKGATLSKAMASPQLEMIRFFYYLNFSLYSKGVIPSLSLKYFPKNEELGKFISLAISFTVISV